MAVLVDIVLSSVEAGMTQPEGVAVVLQVVLTEKAWLETLTVRVYGHESANAFGISEFTSAIIARNKVAVKIVFRYVLFIPNRPTVVVITLERPDFQNYLNIVQASLV
jgi:hypothetical protein